MENVTTDLSLGNILAFAQLAAGMDAEQDVNFISMPVTDAKYSGVSMVLPVVDELLEVLNESFNPYLSDIQSSDLQVLVRNSDGSYSVTGGTLLDSSLASSKGSSSSGSSSGSNSDKESNSSSGGSSGSSNQGQTQKPVEPEEPTEQEPVTPEEPTTPEEPSEGSGEGSQPDGGTTEPSNPDDGQTSGGSEGGGQSSSSGQSGATETTPNEPAGGELAA